MKNYIILNLSLEENSALENILDNDILKEKAFSSKYKANKMLYYNYILLEIETYVSDQDFEVDYQEFLKYINLDRANDVNVQYTIYKLFKSILYSAKALSFTVITIISDDKLGIFYSDGSSSKALNAASYGCCKFLKEDPNGVYDTFSGKTVLYETFSGKIKDGTNNAGELTGIRTAINNFDEHEFQVIISDSNYGLKCYREYIYTWKDNGYKAYSKKEIKNKQLVIDTFQELNECYKNGKIVLFKWTKAHKGYKNNPFNEICDELAKNELGIEKKK